MAIPDWSLTYVVPKVAPCRDSNRESARQCVDHETPMRQEDGPRRAVSVSNGQHQRRYYDSQTQQEEEYSDQQHW